MNRDDIICIAKKVRLGACLKKDQSVDGQGGVWFDEDVNYIDKVEKFFHAAYFAGVAAEREECAKVADENILVWLGDLIRERGKGS